MVEWFFYAYLLLAGSDRIGFEVFWRVHGPPAKQCGMGWEWHCGNALAGGARIIIIKGRVVGADALSDDRFYCCIRTTLT